MNDISPNNLKIERSILTWILEITGLISLSYLWFLFIQNFQSLPENIPIHYNNKGQVNGIGSKYHFIALPIIATVIFTGLSILNRYPYLFNYPVKIHDQNKEKQYRIALLFISYLKCILVLIITAMSFVTIQISQSKSSEIYSGILPVALVLIFGPLLIYIWLSFKAK